MHLPEVRALHTAANAADDGAVLCDKAWRLNDRNKRDEVTLEVLDTGVTSFSIQPKQSNDNAAWYDLGAAITAASVVTVTGIKMPFFKAELEAIVPNGQTISVNAS